jgi:hypothetical protein
MKLRRRSPRSTGQALVEFTLASSLIFFLLAATVDIGLMFFSLQALRVAAQEGATYGSYPITRSTNGRVTAVDYNYQEIYNRIRDSAGNRGTPTNPRSQGIVNLYDLNNNRVRDNLEQNAIFNPSNPSNPNGFVIIENLRGTPGNFTSGTACETGTPGSGLMGGAPNCYIRVTVRYNYNVFFPLMPAFAKQVPLRASFVMKARTTYVGVPSQ